MAAFPKIHRFFFSLIGIERNLVQPLLINFYNSLFPNNSLNIINNLYFYLMQVQRSFPWCTDTDKRVKDLLKEILISEQMIYKCTCYFSNPKTQVLPTIKLNSFYDVYQSWLATSITECLQSTLSKSIASPYFNIQKIVKIENPLSTSLQNAFQV